VDTGRGSQAVGGSIPSLQRMAHSDAGHADPGSNRDLAADHFDSLGARRCLPDSCPAGSKIKDTLASWRCQTSQHVSLAIPSLRPYNTRVPVSLAVESFATFGHVGIVPSAFAKESPMYRRHISQQPRLHPKPIGRSRGPAVDALPHHFFTLPFPDPPSDGAKPPHTYLLQSAIYVNTQTTGGC